MPVLNHVFVDYQNMHVVDPAVFALERTTITLLLGRTNHSLDKTEVRHLMTGSASVELIRIERDGKKRSISLFHTTLGARLSQTRCVFSHRVERQRIRSSD